MTVLIVSYLFFLCFPSLCFPFFFLSRFYPHGPYSAPLFFLSIPLCFFLFFFFVFLLFFLCFFFPFLMLPYQLSLPFLALSSPVFIGKYMGERGLLPLSSHGTGVGWPGRPLYSRPRTAQGVRPLCVFFFTASREATS